MRLKTYIFKGILNLFLLPIAHHAEPRLFESVRELSRTYHLIKSLLVKPENKNWRSCQYDCWVSLRFTQPTPTV